ncbi:MAG: DMT family transporter [Pseudomonadota bacterium]
MNASVIYGLALLVGVVAGVYLPLNGRFAEQIGSPLLATFIFFAVGAMGSGLVWFMFEGVDSLARLRAASAPLFGLGLISFAIILCATLFIPKIGPAAYFVCLIAGQISAGLILSHYGVVAPDKLTLTPMKLIGAALVISGVALITVIETRQKTDVRNADETLTDRASRPDGEPRP